MSWVVDEGVNLFGAGSKNICLALHRVTAPFLCEVVGVVSSLTVTKVRTVLPLGHCNRLRQQHLCIYVPWATPMQILSVGTEYMQIYAA